jgi:Zn ribbon nucleic-acid-binding protein
MGSVIDYIKCSNCNEEAVFDYYYKTGEGVVHCGSCGYYHSEMIKNREKNLNELTESDWEIKEIKNPYGSYKFKVAGDVATCCGTLENSKDADDFRVSMKLEYQGHIEFAEISRMVDGQIEIEKVV